MAPPFPFPIQLLLAALGLVLGSFGNVLIARLPHRESINGRSHCPHCGKTLAVWQLIPVVSFLLLRGRCASCKANISLQYPLVETASAGLFVLAGLLAAPSLLQSLLLGIYLWLLLIIAVIDARTARIHDALNLPLIGSALILAIVRGGIPYSAIAVGTGFLGAQWILTRGRWMGSGDVLLVTGIALLLPDWRIAIVALGIAYILGAIAACVFLLRKQKSTKDMLPFGPFLIIGGLAAILFGERILGILLY
jgi:leader peptidase (prepilin peptidase)/N-methyltransferase